MKSKNMKKAIQIIKDEIESKGLKVKIILFGSVARDDFKEDSD